MEPRPSFRKDLICLDHREAEDRVVIKDTVSDKYYRLSLFEYRFLALFNGDLTLEEVIDKFQYQGHYCTPDQGKMMLGRAAQLGLMLGTQYGTARYQTQLRERYEEAGKTRLLSSLYFLYIPLLNPDRFLERTLWVFKALANRLTLGLAACLVPGAVYFLITGIPSMEREYLFFFNLENLFFLWITIALTKLVHEFAHAYTAKSFGLNVPQMGIAFLIFFPCLFCNTTDAWQLADRRQRIAISAAGIIAEAVIAVTSTYIWHFSRPGLLNSLAFYLMAVSFISTVLFNGNPLMKFDGYFMLIDAIRTPNLQAKSLGYVRRLFMNGVLGLESGPNPAGDTREGALFLVYGISAFVYRVFLYTGIVAGVYYRFDKMLGILLASAAFGLYIVRPVMKGILTLLRKRSEIKPRLVGAIVFILPVAGLVGALCIPLSDRSTFPCYVASAHVQKLTVPLGTFVGEMHTRLGSSVEKGALLYELDPSLLELTLVKKEAQRDVLVNQVRMLLLDAKERGKAVGRQAEVVQAEEEIRRITVDLNMAKSGVIAPFTGTVTALDYRMQRGYYPGEGAIVGELQSTEECVILGLVPEPDRHKVAPGRDAEVWLPIGGRGRTFRGKIDTVKPYSERNLRDSPFSSRLGGELAVEAKGEHHRDAPLEAQYMCSVKVNNTDGSLRLGMTGRLTVPSPPQSILSRVWDGLFRTFAKESLI
ncbi:MAG: site-2 protease family protein [Pseudomonadota bacterium]